MRELKPLGPHRTRTQVLKQVQEGRGHPPPHRTPKRASSAKGSRAATTSRPQPGSSGDFPFLRTDLGSTEALPKGGLWGCPSEVSSTLLGQDRETSGHPPRPTTWAPVLGVARKQKLPKIPLFKLSIFIIKIITSLVKVQMLQHGVKTPLE